MQPMQTRGSFRRPPVDTSERIEAFVAAGTAGSAGNDTGGNPCLLRNLEWPPGDAPPARAALTQCQAWPARHDDGPAIAVRCFSPGGGAIACCGHGLLAAAYSWQRRLQCDELALSMHGSLVHSRRQGDITWLRFKLLPTRPCALPHWLPQLFPGQTPALAAAVAGDQRGYLVLQWADGFDLARLQPALATLATRSQRALICTAAQPLAGAGAIQLRYFAPRYGVNEDTATGSAMRVLGHYWSARFKRLAAQQRSPRGGYLLARVDARGVDVGGYCRMLAADGQEAAHA